MTDQPDNEIKVINYDGYAWVDVTCGSLYGGFCNVGVASARSNAAALRRAVKRLRKLADKCESLISANSQADQPTEP